MSLWDNKRKIYWKGWENISFNGLHMIISKIHLVIDGKTACGKNAPRDASINSGRGVCKKCMAAIPRLSKEYEIDGEEY